MRESHGKGGTIVARLSFRELSWFSSVFPYFLDRNGKKMKWKRSGMERRNRV